MSQTLTPIFPNMEITKEVANSARFRPLTDLLPKTFPLTLFIFWQRRASFDFFLGFGAPALPLGPATSVPQVLGVPVIVETADLALARPRSW